MLLLQLFQKKNSLKILTHIINKNQLDSENIWHILGHKINCKCKRNMSDFKNLTIGILALQGDYECHKNQLDLLGAKSSYVRLPKHLANIDALIIPGGESTTISKLIDRFGLREPLVDFGESKPIWGTCAGMILLSNEIEANQANVKPLQLLDIDIARTAFGRQVFSFETELILNLNGKEVKSEASFIRAPRIKRISKGVNILATYENEAVLVEKDNIMASSFHTELENDTTLLKFFLENYLVDILNK